MIKMPVYWLSIILLMLGARCDIAQKVAEKASPNALWWVVSTCVQNEKGKHPVKLCEKVDLKRGYVVLKDRSGKTQFLLVPTEHVIGVESPEILKKDAHNYWLDAWESRDYVSKRAGRKLSDEDIGLAINSSNARTQNQLHIHIDCLKKGVIAKLRASQDVPSGQWFRVRFPYPLHNYDALYVRSLRPDPFKVVAKMSKDMSSETMVIARVGKRFILLADVVNPLKGDWASGEELLDHECAVANQG